MKNERKNSVENLKQIYARLSVATNQQELRNLVHIDNGSMGKKSSLPDSEETKNTEDEIKSLWLKITNLICSL